MSAAAGSGISDEALTKLQDSREALEKEVTSLVLSEIDLRTAVAAEKIAAAGPQSESQVGNSQAEGSEQERALEYVSSEIDRIRKEITTITEKIRKLIGAPEGGRRRRRSTRRRHVGRRKRTLRR
jgi:hypothetical protein